MRPGFSISFLSEKPIYIMKKKKHYSSLVTLKFIIIYHIKIMISIFWQQFQMNVMPHWLKIWYKKSNNSRGSLETNLDNKADATIFTWPGFSNFPLVSNLANHYEDKDLSAIIMFASQVDFN